MDAYAMAEKYYPEYWPLKRLEALIAAGKLSEQEVHTIVENVQNKTEERTESIIGEVI